jgi:hypothetical protein
MEKRFLTKAIVSLFAVVALICSCKDDDEAPLRTECEITSFKVGDDAWTITGTNITKAYAEANEALTPKIEVSPGATVSPASDVAQNFFTEAGVEYTVTAESGKKQKYTAKASVIDPTKSDAKLITSFVAADTAWTITESDSTITVTFPEGTVKNEALTPTIVLSEGATVSPLATVPQNFFVEGGVTYTVTAENGTTRTYKVTAIVIDPTKSDAKLITSFVAADTAWLITESDSTITVTFPEGTEKTELTPTIELSEGATVNPASGIAKDFFVEGGVTYTVTAENGTTRTYKVTATVTESEEPVEPVEPVLKVTPTILAGFSSDGGDQSVIVTANLLYTIEVSYDVDIEDGAEGWVTYNIADDSVLTITVAANDDIERIATVTLKTEVEEVANVELTVTQAADVPAQPTLLIDRDALTFSYDDTAPQIVNVTANLPYTFEVTEDATWVRVVTAGNILTITTVETNVGDEERSATVTLSAEGVEDVFLTVMQKNMPVLGWIEGDKATNLGWTATANVDHYPDWYGTGEPWQILDGDTGTGWHTNSPNDGTIVPPYILVIDMQESKTVHSLKISHLAEAVADDHNWIYMDHVQIYLSDTDPLKAGVSPYDDSWPRAIEYQCSRLENPFFIELNEGNNVGQYLILRFHDSMSGNDISFTELDVQVEQ